MSTFSLPLRISHLSFRMPLVVGRLFAAWLILRTVAWTLIALAQPNPPLDTVEWLAWGQTWQMGYHKHPPLAAWVADAAYRLTPGSFLGVYLAGYLAVALALWCVWSVARQVLPPRAAVISVVCLDGLVFLGPAAAEFNNQVLLIAFWAWAIERFHAAVLFDRWRDWILTGLALGLALLCKYSAFLLVLPLLAWWIWQNGLRRWTRPLIVALVTAAVFLPHFLWLIEHDFPTLRYAALRAEGGVDAPDARLSGLYFVFSQVLRLVPVFFILLPVLQPHWRILDSRAGRTRSLLLAAVLGPVALHLAAPIVGGVRLRDIWGAPLWTYSGLLVVVLCQTDDGGRAWRRLWLVWGSVLGLTAALVLGSNLHGSAWRSRPMRVHYPGLVLAEEVTARYSQRHGVPPTIVAGDWWLAGNVCCHATHRPLLYGSREPAYLGLDLRKVKGDPRQFLSPDPRTAPWTGDEDLVRRGGVLLWDAGVYGEDLPPWLHERFPAARGERVIRLRAAGGGGQLAVGWATIAPGQ